VHPTETQSFIQGVQVRDRRSSGLAFVEDEPHLAFGLMVIGQPLPPFSDRMSLAQFQRFRGHADSTDYAIRLRRTPTPSSSTSTTSPDFIALVDPGVPVKMTSPGRSVAK